METTTHLAGWHAAIRREMFFSPNASNELRLLSTRKRDRKALRKTFSAWNFRCGLRLLPISTGFTASLNTDGIDNVSGCSGPTRERRASVECLHRVPTLASPAWPLLRRGGGGRRSLSSRHVRVPATLDEGKRTSSENSQQARSSRHLQRNVETV